MTSLPTLLTTTEVAEVLGVTDETVRRWIKANRLSAITLPSGRMRIRRESVDAVLATEQSERSA